MRASRNNRSRYSSRHVESPKTDIDTWTTKRTSELVYPEADYALFMTITMASPSIMALIVMVEPEIE